MMESIVKLAATCEIVEYRDLRLTSEFLVPQDDIFYQSNVFCKPSQESDPRPDADSDAEDVEDSENADDDDGTEDDDRFDPLHAMEKILREQALPLQDERKSVDKRSGAQTPVEVASPVAKFVIPRTKSIEENRLLSLMYPLYRVNSVETATDFTKEWNSTANPFQEKHSKRYRVRLTNNHLSFQMVKSHLESENTRQTLAPVRESGALLAQSLRAVQPEDGFLPVVTQQADPRNSVPEQPVQTNSSASSNSPPMKKNEDHGTVDNAIT